MEIILKDGTKLEAIKVDGTRKYVESQNRDTLTFWFHDDGITMDQLDSAFCVENCEEIIIKSDGEEYRHVGYTIRTGLSKIPVQINGETPDIPAAVNMRLSVTMAQRTYAETQLNALLLSQMELQNTVDILTLNTLFGDEEVITYV